MPTSILAQPTASQPPSTSLIAGLATALVLAVVALWFGQASWVQNLGISALTLAVLLGMVIAPLLTTSQQNTCKGGLGFAKKYLLQAGIVLYGFRLTLGDLGQLGWKGFAVDALMLSSTFAIACLLGKKLLKLDTPTTLLIGAGSSICGAAAILATQPVVKANERQVSAAIATILLFGTLAMLSYPLLFSLLAAPLQLTHEQFGLFTGATIHEVAQVVAAGASVNPEVEASAVIAKMGRVVLLAPFLLALAFGLHRLTTANKASQQTSEAHQAKSHNKTPSITVPWFAFLFIAVIGLNSLVSFSPVLIDAIRHLDDLLLTMAMVALGLATPLHQLIHLGAKPFVLGALLFVWLVGAGLGLTLLLGS